MGCMLPAETVCPMKLTDTFLLSQWMSHIVKFGKQYLIAALCMYSAWVNILRLKL